MSQVPLQTLAPKSNVKHISIPQTNAPAAVVVSTSHEHVEACVTQPHLHKVEDHKCVDDKCHPKRVEPVCHIDKYLACHPKKVEPVCHIDKCHPKKVEPVCHIDKCHPKKVVTKCCEHADDPGHHHHHYAWGWLAQLIIWLVIFTVIWWLILYSLKPSFVLTNGLVDSAKVLLYSVIAASLTMLIVYLIKAAVYRRAY
jgi:hypothetical protein